LRHAPRERPDAADGVLDDAGDRPRDAGGREGEGRAAPVTPSAPLIRRRAGAREGGRMSVSSTVSLHPHPPGPGRQPEAREVRSSPAGGRPRMVLVAAGASSGGDVPGLLRRRLRFFSLLVLIIFALSSLYAGRLVVDTGLALVVNVGLTALLWSRAPLSW